MVKSKCNYHSIRFDPTHGIADGDEFDLIRLWQQKSLIQTQVLKDPPL